MFDLSKAHSPRIRDRIRDVLHEYYIQVSTTKMTRADFEGFIDQIIAIFTQADEEVPPSGPE